jgi:hypothetical protein
MTGMKFDNEKPMADLLLDMPLALSEVIDVLTQGAEKYAPGNWAHVDSAERRYKAASFRHELAFIGAIAYLLSDLDENSEPREYME